MSVSLAMDALAVESICLSVIRSVTSKPRVGSRSFFNIHYGPFCDAKGEIQIKWPQTVFGKKTTSEMATQRIRKG